MASFCAASNFYPFPFLQGISASDAHIDNGTLIWQDIPIAWGVRGFYNDSGIVSGLILEGKIMNFSNGTMLSFYTNRDDQMLAITVMGSVNAVAGGMGVCEARMYGSDIYAPSTYWVLRRLGPVEYNLLIESAFKLFDKNYPNAQYIKINADSWKVSKK